MAALTASGVYAALATGPAGLSASECAARQARFGANALPSPPRSALWRRFVQQFRDLFAILLLIASGIAFLTYFPDDYNPYDLEVGAAILTIVLLNAAIGFAQEYQAEQATQALQRLVPHTARVLRDGQAQQIEATELVPGDVLALEEGDDVSADARLVRAYELSTNNASLTGESTPARKTADPILESRLAETEFPNLVFMGTNVASGSGQAVVYATGLSTQFGQIYRLTARIEDRPSPLQLEVGRMAALIARAALAIGAVMFTLGHFLGLGLVEDLLFAIGVMVAVVPEGMPATLSVALAVGVQQMARRAALIKRLSAVETLGSSTVICTDKTGTLTRGQMTALVLVVGDQQLRFTGTGYSPQGNLVDHDGISVPAPSPAVFEALRCAALCTTARLVPPRQPGEEWGVIGDPTEGALLIAAMKGGLSDEQRSPRVGLLPFDSSRKRMTSIHDVDGTPIAYMKGAPREVIEQCTRLWTAGADCPWPAQGRQRALALNDALAAQSLRVLALARRALPREQVKHAADEVERELCFLGLIGLMDPPRPEVAEAVSTARRAGIRIHMVTGDYGLTADAVARSLGIVEQGKSHIVTGFELDHMDDAQLRDVVQVKSPLIFARVTPEHKLRIVTACQAVGEVVAATGDGVNDAPALKRADIGVAMGRSGTDVARGAAAMILLDDSFASIVHAIQLGRAVYDNIRRFIIYLFSHNMAELLPFVFSTMAGVNLVPLNALQVLSIDLGSDVLPALALGTDAPERDVMNRPPRERGAHLLDRDTIGRIFFLGGIQATGAIVAFLNVLVGGGWHWGVHLPTDDPLYRHAITATQAAIVVSQVFNGFAVRTARGSVFTAGLFRNRRLLAAEAIGVALMALISYAPPFQHILNTAPLDPRDWIIVTAFGALLLIAEELRKAWLRARDSSRSAPRGEPCT